MTDEQIKVQERPRDLKNRIAHIIEEVKYKSGPSKLNNEYCYNFESLIIAAKILEDTFFDIKQREKVDITV